MAAANRPLRARALRSSELMLRVCSALVLVPLAIGTAYLGGWPFALFWGAAALGVLWEWISLVAPSEERFMLLTGGAALALAVALAGMGHAWAAVVVLAMGALGLVLAASIRSIENFAGVMNFVVFPMLFLSGALYPVRHLGPVLRAAACVNPLAYGVDLLKHALLGGWARAGYGGELPVPLDCAALVLFAIVGLAVAALLLGREGGVTRTAFRERR